MSRRWFILIFSLFFLFAFRVWINNASSSKGFNISDRLSGDYLTGNEKDYFIFRTAANSKTIKTGAAKYIVMPGIPRYSSEFNLIDGEPLYIFPDWPDNLSFDFQEVVVDNHSPLNSYINTK